MLTTRCYDDVKAQFGERLFRAVGCRWDGDDNQVIVDGLYRTVPAAKSAARAWVARRGVDQVEIRRGAWAERVLHSSGCVPVYDAAFEEEDGWALRAWADAGGGIDWEEEAW